MMPRVPTHLCERALGMLQGGMKTADMARAKHGNVRTVRHVRQRYRETGWTADRPRSGRPRVTTPAQDRYIRTSHLRDRYRMATTTARVSLRTHNPSISAQTVRNRLREAELRAFSACCKAGPHQTSPATTSPMGTNPPSLDQTGLAKSALH
uniref:Transposase Tc1-like domain-containing protein n=1 Tax=Oncorhynchus tshawytscha TaxID=74940 RepID=A0AAZ3PT11_ONCTS